jgi:hypothetical protein
MRTARAAAPSWSFTLYLDVPSQNSLSGNHGKWSAIRRYRKLRRDATLLMTSYKNVLEIPTATGKRRITWTRILGPRQRLFDEMNFIGGLKALADSATAAGLLVDDKPKFYEGVYRQDDTRRAEGPALEVLIEELSCR